MLIFVILGTIIELLTPVANVFGLEILNDHLIDLIPNENNIYNGYV
jgi:hypothetical protein